MPSQSVDVHNFFKHICHQVVLIKNHTHSYTTHAVSVNMYDNQVRIPKNSRTVSYWYQLITFRFHDKTYLGVMLKRRLFMKAKQ